MKDKPGPKPRAVRPGRQGVDPGGFLSPGSSAARRPSGVGYVPPTTPRDPRNTRKLAIDWTVVANEYITGVSVEKNGEWKRVYPSFADLGIKYGLKKSTLSYRCVQENWAERRLKFNAQLSSEVESELAKRRALDVSDLVGTLDDYIRKFDKGVKADTVTRASVTDLDKAVRLRLHVIDSMRARESGAGIVTIEQLQERHSKMRTQAAESSDEGAGYVPGRIDREAAGEIEQLAVAKADAKVAEAEARAHEQADRANRHLNNLGSARQKARDAAGGQRVRRYRERAKRLAALDSWAQALFLAADHNGKPSLL